MNRSVATLTLAGCLFAALLPGCAYRLGPTNGLEAGARSIQIDTFQNRTLQPGLSSEIVEAIRRKIQEDGTYRLATQKDGNLVVTGTVVTYERRPLAFRPRDVESVEDYELILVCRVVATERDGKKVLDQEVRGRTTIRVFEDQNASERQAGPMLANDLARNITALLVDGTW